jgi:hypothetical protein
LQCRIHVTRIAQVIQADEALGIIIAIVTVLIIAIFISKILVIELEQTEKFSIVC